MGNYYYSPDIIGENGGGEIKMKKKESPWKQAFHLSKFHVLGEGKVPLGAMCSPDTLEIFGWCG
jgi:hypothetical protein